MKKLIITRVVLTSLLILILVYLTNANNTQAKKDVLPSFNYSSIPDGCSYDVFNGTSMQSTIMRDNIVVGCPISEYIIEEGDIVCYNIQKYCKRIGSCPNSLLEFKYNCHRIIDITDEYYIAKGDSCKFPWCSATEKVKKEEIEYLIVGVLN